jgi:threonine 3-dehydrogenase
MKAIVKARPERGGLEFRDLPIPEPGMGEVLVKMRSVAICGTDLHIYNWDAWSQKRVKTPRTLGHEFAGTVVKCGPAVTFVKEGDYVSGEGHIVCGFCLQCRTGEGHVCQDWKGLGYDIDGCFAEYLVYPERNLWKNDPALPPDQAACQDPLGNATHTAFAADCVSKRVAVFGLGPVGLFTVAVLKAIGAAEIVAVDWNNRYRMDIARRLGAHHVVAAAEQSSVEAIRQLTGGHGVDVCLEISGAESAIRDALHSVRLGGTMVMIGTPNTPVSFDLASDVIFRSLTIKGVTGRRIWDTWYRMAGLFKSGQLDIAPIITHHLPFDQYERGFELMATGQCGKVVLEL